MKRARVEVNLSELDQLLDQACQAPLSESDCQKIKAALHALAEWVTARRTKKTVVPPAKEDSPPAAGEGQPEKEKPNGHRRTAATAYAGADRVEVKHPELQHGDRCPADTVCRQ